MRRRTQIELQGQMFNVIEHEFEIAGPENWHEYRLLDGGRVKIKTVVTRIFTVVDTAGKVQRGPEGEPQMIVRHTQIVVASDDVELDE